jgi:Immunoglobulin-like domain of bacterial spore germination
MVLVIEVRQPRQHDLIASTFPLAGFGTGFEATVLLRMLEQDDDVLGEGKVQGVGSMGVIDDCGHDVSLPDSARAGERTSCSRSSATTPRGEPAGP